LSEAVARPASLPAGARVVRSPGAHAARRLLRSRSALVGGSLLIAIAIATLLAPLLSPYDPLKTNQRDPLVPPGAAHPMGTDRFGRDILSRVLWGGRISLSVGVVAVGIAACSGVVLGLTAGYYGRKADAVIMRFTDLLLAFPGILLALAIVATLGSSLVNLMIAVGIAAIPEYVRVTRGTVLGLMEQEYVLAAKVVGCRDEAVLFKHILPNVAGPVIVLATLGTAGAIITGSALSFLGLGLRPPAPEWGNMLAEGREFLQYAWWVAFFPGLAIMIAVLAINLFGDGLRDALDPRLPL
jgi:peptide/nickel transport system permease protein